MPSSPTSRSRFEKQGSGENANTWGAKLNTTGLDLLDEAIDGVETIALTANLTLSVTNFASDQQRNKAYRFTGTGAFTVTIPASEQVKLFINATTGTLTVSNGTNSTTIGAGKSYWVASDGTNLFKDTTEEAAAAAAETSASNAATSASNASTSATNAANSATNSANSATNSANSATNSANSATSSANSAILSSDWAQKTGATVDGTGFSAKHWAGEAKTSSGIPLGGSALQVLRKNAANDGTEWATPVSVTPTAQTTAYTVTTSDSGKFFDTTGLTGPIAFSHAAASTYPPGFHYWVRMGTYNASTIRYVTPTPNGTDLIDGVAASLNIYAETVKVVRNAAGTGWVVEKSPEVVCWAFTVTTAAAAIEFTTPFNDAQFEAYAIEYQVEQGGSATNLLAKLAFGGAFSGNHSASGISSDVSGAVSGFGNGGALTLMLTGTTVTIAEGVIGVTNARGAGAGAKGPLLKCVNYSGGNTSIGSGTSANSGALSHIRFTLANGFNFNATATRFRIIGFRKGN